MGGFQLQVADACNGLRYLFPLLSLSFLLAYLYKGSLWKRALIFFSALPISIALNGLRIAMIGITVDRWGPQMARGLVHELEGWVIFLGCAALLFATAQALQLVGRKAAIDFGALRLPQLGRLSVPSVGKPVIAGMALLAAVSSASATLPSGLPDFVKSVPLRRPFALFPAQLGPWTGHFSSLDPASLSVLGTTDYLMADYSKPGTPPVNLYVLYYPRQDSTSNSVVHAPTVCIPAGGWDILDRSTRRVSLRDGERFDVNRLVIGKGSDRSIVYYWFDEGGSKTANPFAARLRLVWQAISRRTSNGAMIRIFTRVDSTESETEADHRLREFVDSIETIKPLVRAPGEQLTDDARTWPSGTE